MLKFQNSEMESIPLAEKVGTVLDELFEIIEEKRRETNKEVDISASDEDY
jgi:hypothetical protein